MYLRVQGGFVPYDIPLLDKGIGYVDIRISKSTDIGLSPRRGRFKLVRYNREW